MLLTILTQIGGAAYLAAWLAPARRRFRRPLVFLIAYGGLWMAAYLAAPSFGRVPLPCFAGAQDTLAMQSPLYCALNRHYVTPALRATAARLADHVAARHPGALTQALDAGFPFLNGFPLLPHLSHDDGRKLDLAFYYRAPEGGYQRGATRSPIGYWAFERPRPGEWDACPKPTPRFGLRWEMRWFEIFDAALALDAARTRTALAWLRDRGPAHGVQRVFVEPHLAGRLGVTGGVIRFQGCRAARHDDHIHFQTVR